MGQGILAKITGVFSAGGQASANDAGEERRQVRAGDSIHFAIFMPSSQEDALKSADAMKNGNGVVINGEYLDEVGYRRVTDFLDGAAYVLGGSGRRVSDNVQIYVPAFLEIVDETVSYYGNLNTGKKRSDG
jgi:cell division inhibitor SepF